MQLDHARRHQRTPRIAQRYADGVPVDDICNEFECARNTVLRIARMFGIPKRPKATDPERKARIIEAYKRGDAIKNIAARERVHASWVSHCARDAGILRRTFDKSNLMKKDEDPSTS